MDENIEKLWETKYKPLILSYRKVPQSVVAEVLGCDAQKVNEMLRSGMYTFGTARKDPTKPNSKYTFDIYPLRFVAWYEGRLA